MGFEQFGKYLLLHKVAVGGMAEIYLAKQLGMAGFEKIVVIKRIQPAFANDPDFVEMFLDEARLVAQLSHPNIAQVFDLDRVGDIVYIAMEYVSGQDLHRLLKHCQKNNIDLPPAVILRILIGACDGLHYAHTLKDSKGQPLNIVHRDATPSNMLLSYDGVTKLIDFGIAKSESHVLKTVIGMVKGKYPYMAPEQINAKQLDARADVWTMGVVLWESLALRRLFKGPNELAIINAIFEQPVPPLTQLKPELPKKLDDIVGTALQRDPSKRYPSVLHMQKELEKLLGSLPVTCTTREVSLFLKHVFAQEFANHEKLLADLPHATPELFAQLVQQTEPSSYAGMSAAKPNPWLKKKRTSKKLIAGLAAATLAVLTGLVWLVVHLSAPSMGEISVTSVPEGASVFLDGLRRAEQTPTTLRQVTMGRHEISLELQGRESQTAVVELEKEQPAVAVTLTLAPTAAALATLNVKATPEGATVSLDGAAPVASPATFEGVSADGDHTVTVARDGYRTKSLTVKLQPGVTRDVAVELTDEAATAVAARTDDPRLEKSGTRTRGGKSAKATKRRLHRVKKAWKKKRASVSSSDRRLFDQILVSISKLVASGKRKDLAEARTSMDDFVKTALRGVEP